MGTTQKPSPETISRMLNLARANELRCEMAVVKRQLAAGEVGYEQVIRTSTLPIRLDQLVGALPRVGAKAAKKIFAAAGIYPSRRLSSCQRDRGLTPTQREQLIVSIRAHCPKLPGVVK